MVACSRASMNSRFCLALAPDQDLPAIVLAMASMLRLLRITLAALPRLPVSRATTICETVATALDPPPDLALSAGPACRANDKVRMAATRHARGRISSPDLWLFVFPGARLPYIGQSAAVAREHSACAGDPQSLRSQRQQTNPAQGPGNSSILASTVWSTSRRSLIQLKIDPSNFIDKILAWYQLAKVSTEHAPPRLPDARHGP